METTFNVLIILLNNLYLYTVIHNDWHPELSTA